jgi:hypothetical protein
MGTDALIAARGNALGNRFAEPNGRVVRRPDMQTHTPELTVARSFASDETSMVATGQYQVVEQAPARVSNAPSSALARLISWVTSPATTAPRATILIRLMAGAVFFSEGLLKFVYTNQGVGRFTKLGFPFPDTVATAIGVFEIVGGVLLISGYSPVSSRSRFRSRWSWQC